MGKVTASAPAANPDDVIPIDELDDSASSAIAIRTAGAVGSLTGAISASDIPIPLLGIAYGVGSLAEKFSPGDIILDREHLLVHKLEPLNAIIIQAHVYWKEYLDPAAFQAGIRPRVFATDKDVIAAGGSIEFGPNGERPTFKRAMTLKLLLEKPANVTCSLFAVDLLGKSYAPAIWYVDKTAYQRGRGKGVGVTIMKQMGYALKERGLLAGKWQITTAFEEVGVNKVIAPNIDLVGQYSDEEIKLIKAAVGA